MATTNSATIIKAIKSLADKLGATYREESNEDYSVSVTHASKVFCTGGKNYIRSYYGGIITKASALNRLLKNLKNGTITK